jgi:predicted RNA-binding protein with RPS1 domain
MFYLLVLMILIKNIKLDTVPNLNPNVIYEASVVNIQHYGMICDIVDTEFVGLIHSSKLPLKFMEKYSLGATVKVKTIEFNKQHNKYSLKLAEQ